MSEESERETIKSAAARGCYDLCCEARDRGVARMMSYIDECDRTDAMREYFALRWSDKYAYRATKIAAASGHFDIARKLSDWSMDWHKSRRDMPPGVLVVLRGAIIGNHWDKFAELCAENNLDVDDTLFFDMMCEIGESGNISRMREILDRITAGNFPRRTRVIDYGPMWHPIRRCISYDGAVCSLFAGLASTGNRELCEVFLNLHDDEWYSQHDMVARRIIARALEYDMLSIARRMLKFDRDWSAAGSGCSDCDVGKHGNIEACEIIADHDEYFISMPGLFEGACACLDMNAGMRICQLIVAKYEANPESAKTGGLWRHLPNAIHIAIRTGNIELCKYLISVGVIVDRAPAIDFPSSCSRAGLACDMIEMSGRSAREKICAQVRESPRFCYTLRAEMRKRGWM